MRRFKLHLFSDSLLLGIRLSSFLLLTFYLKTPVRFHCLQSFLSSSSDGRAVIKLLLVQLVSLA